MAADAQQELTHEELWDDSALVASWDEALEEYKKYHSLAARGEKAPTVEAPKIQSKADAMLSNGTQAKPQPPPQKAKATTSTSNADSAAPINFIGPVPPPTQSAASQVASVAPAAPSGMASMPQTLLGNNQDETLKNIMMSWYYAGYYTGLYEGQQKAWAQWAETQQGGEEDEEAV